MLCRAEHDASASTKTCCYFPLHLSYADCDRAAPFCTQAGEGAGPSGESAKPSVSVQERVKQIGDKILADAMPGMKQVGLCLAGCGKPCMHLPACSTAHCASRLPACVRAAQFDPCRYLAARAGHVISQ